MNKSLRLGAILLTITGLTGFFLAMAYTITREPIARSQLRQKNEALMRVLPGGEIFSSLRIPPSEDAYFSEMFEGREGDRLVGYVLRVHVTGYGGTLQMMVGLDPSGTVTGVDILAHRETPGLGARAEEPFFLEQFVGRGPGPLKVLPAAGEEGEGIEALSGATITSRSVAQGVESATAFFRENRAFWKGEHP